tara:strand:+ start:311 stop:592 length:282 start_codon:yes stop_codon:yes gene_type:complete
VDKKKKIKKVSKLLKVKKLYKKLICSFSKDDDPEVAKKISGPSINIPVSSKILEIKKTIWLLINVKFNSDLELKKISKFFRRRTIKSSYQVES